MKQNKFQRAVSGVPSPSNIVWVEKPVEFHVYQISKQGVLPDWLLYALKNGKAKRLERGDGSLQGFYVKVETDIGPRKLWAGKGDVILRLVDDDKCEHLAVISEKLFKGTYITKRALTIQGIAERVAMNESSRKINNSYYRGD